MIVGLISHAPGRKPSDLAVQAAQVDAMVREKLTGTEYIILCLEDCADWGHATTRKVVMQVWLLSDSNGPSSLQYM